MLKQWDYHTQGLFENIQYSEGSSLQTKTLMSLPDTYCSLSIKDIKCGKNRGWRKTNWECGVSHTRNHTALENNLNKCSLTASFKYARSVATALGSLL